MTSQGLLWLSVVLGGLLALGFLTGRQAVRPPSRLNLRAKAGSLGGGAVDRVPQRPGSNLLSHKLTLDSMVMDPATLEEVSVHSEEKSLNIMFMYNGHSWDAYEVLGIPAGSGQREVDEAFRRMISNSTTDSHEFLNAAYRVICESQSIVLQSKSHRSDS